MIQQTSSISTCILSTFAGSLLDRLNTPLHNQTTRRIVVWVKIVDFCDMIITRLNEALACLPVHLNYTVLTHILFRIATVPVA